MVMSPARFDNDVRYQFAVNTAILHDSTDLVLVWYCLSLPVEVSLAVAVVSEVVGIVVKDFGVQWE